MADAKGLKKTLKTTMTVPKRTSQGIAFKPKNKHKRKNWKAYVGQGRP